MLTYHLTRVQATIRADKWGTLTFHEENGRRHRCLSLEKFDNLKVAVWRAVVQSPNNGSMVGLQDLGIALSLCSFTRKRERQRQFLTVTVSAVGNTAARPINMTT
jgi:hypothetical protein